MAKPKKKNANTKNSEFDFLKRNILDEIKKLSRQGANIIKDRLQKSIRYIKKTMEKAEKRFAGFSLIMHKVTDSWKPVFGGFIAFIFIYYAVGSQISENIDVATEYSVSENNRQDSQIVKAMRYLVLREIDDKLWTPNLPIIFPAYILDNMPNFQKGMIAAVKNITGVLRHDESISEQQKSDLNKAYKLLNYAPDVWLLQMRDSYKIASSTNKQYRKAAKFLGKFNEHNSFSAQQNTLNALLREISSRLTEISQKSETYQLEHSADIWDFKSDDIFYYNLGYAFALLQICKAMGADFKYVILEDEAYVEWTYLLSSLQKVTQYRPYVIRNGNPQGFWAPNHLTVQNYYLSRAISWAEKMRNKVPTELYYGD